MGKRRVGRRDDVMLARRFRALGPGAHRAAHVGVTAASREKSSASPGPPLTVLAS
jgi:hypothetical protein